MALAPTSPQKRLGTQMERHHGCESCMALATRAAKAICEAVSPPFVGCGRLSTHVKPSFMHDVLSNGPHTVSKGLTPACPPANSKTRRISLCEKSLPTLKHVTYLGMFPSIPQLTMNNGFRFWENPNKPANFSGGEAASERTSTFCPPGPEQHC
jgi:hypothetical protein